MDESNNKTFFWFISITNILILVTLVLFGFYYFKVSSASNKCDSRELTDGNAIQTGASAGNLNNGTSTQGTPAQGDAIGKCGDNICDDFEKTNKNVCPKDCQ